MEESQNSETHISTTPTFHSKPLHIPTTGDSLRRSRRRRRREQTSITLTSRKSKIIKEEEDPKAESTNNSQKKEEEEEDKEEIEKKIEALQKIVPGGESLGMDKLFDETAGYIMALQYQIKGLRALSCFFEKLEKEKAKLGG